MSFFVKFHFMIPESLVDTFLAAELKAFYSIVLNQSHKVKQLLLCLLVKPLCCFSFAYIFGVSHLKKVFCLHFSFQNIIKYVQVILKRHLSIFLLRI